MLVQPYLRAPLLMLAVVLDREGRAVRRFAQVAERTWPRKAGTAAVIVSVTPDPDLVDAAPSSWPASDTSGSLSSTFWSPKTVRS